MVLSESDVILVGIGHLYGPPFLSRFLLYRLFDINRTVLICHKSTNEVATNSNYFTHASTVVQCGLPTKVYVHFCVESANATLEELLRLPANEISIKKNGTSYQRYNSLTISIEDSYWESTEKQVMVFRGLYQESVRLEQSEFCVSGPLHIARTPEKVVLAKMKSHCLKVYVSDSSSGINYNLHKNGNWELTALDMEDEGQPSFEVNLRKSKKH